VKAQFPYRSEDGDLLVATLIENLRADPSFVAGCLVIGHAHGFTMEIEYAQRADGSARYRTWSDVQGHISSEERPLHLDLASLFAQHRREHPESGRIAAKPGDGRLALVVLANRDEGAWLETPTPGPKQVRGDSAIDQLFRIVYPS
jgi:hypothetical protein